MKSLGEAPKLESCKLLLSFRRLYIISPLILRLNIYFLYVFSEKIRNYFDVCILYSSELVQREIWKSGEADKCREDLRLCPDIKIVPSEENRE